MTLIEVLVALLLLGLMVSGMFRLQNQSINVSKSALWWNQANTIATEAVSRIQANPDGEAIYLSKSSWLKTQKNEEALCGYLESPCSPSALAALDIAHLLDRVDLLPTGRIVASRCRDAGMRCLYVAWSRTPVEACQPFSDLTTRTMESVEQHNDLLKLNCVVLEF